MSPTNLVWLGIGPPNVYWYPVTSAQLATNAGTIPANDLTTVTAVTFHVYYPGTSLVTAVTPDATWTGVIFSATAPSGSTPSTLMAYHAFATPDCQLVGNYSIVGVLAVPGGTWECFKRVLVVQPEQNT